jgi:hypothetical protein
LLLALWAILFPERALANIRGRKSTGLKVLNTALRRGELNRPRGTGFASGRSYVRRLRKFLAKNGYG